jgi:Myb-like DNA-binding domain
VKLNGDRKWCKISKDLTEKSPSSQKTGKQCRERWHNHLNPDLSKETFTLEDEIKVFEYQKQLGNKWSEIAKFFEGRNDNFIKNCFYSAIRRNLRKYNKKKVPSKQLKGTISSLLRNAYSRKILMNFPEHQNLEIAKTKEDVVKMINLKKEPRKSVENPKVWIESKPKPLPELIVNTKVPGYMMINRTIDEITPILNNHFSFGVNPDEIELPVLNSNNASLELCKTDSNRTDASSKRSTILPDFTPIFNYQFNYTPRNSI